MTTGIYRFSVDYGRGYGVEGTFAAKAEDVKRIKGKRIYFGEICGKHSEVTATPNDDNLVLLTDEPSVVEAFIKHGFASGHNPVSYYEAREDEDEGEG